MVRSKVLMVGILVKLLQPTGKYPTVANSEGERGVAKLNQGVKKTTKLKLRNPLILKGFFQCVSLKL
ncbi:hypothetical protein MWLf4_1185 [Limosilactobacillus fermentum]|nr:hypothetical protein MWLf4_1185 [Limosilactobacillus fermentum]